MLEPTRYNINMSPGVWTEIAGAFTLIASVLATAHVILTKKNARASFAWVGIVWLVPVIGPVLYLLFGINRIKRKAQILRSGLDEVFPFHITESRSSQCAIEPQTSQLKRLCRMTERISGLPLLPGNRITPLEDGDNAYQAMLRVIDEAERSISLSTYIFDNDRVGEMFLSALARARERGVAIRVLVDDMGARYSFPSIVKSLKKSGIEAATFLPTLIPSRVPFVNLRNHRKILIVDGKTGFTGGMNIREGHLLRLNPPSPVRDIHFLVEGPVVKQMQQVFVEDWYFSTGEMLEGDLWFRKIPSSGDVLARGIPDGPDEDYEKHLHTILSALTMARKTVVIVTPYFLPEDNIVTAINLAALRGVKIDIILPEKNNIPLIKWASHNILEQIIGENCNLWFSKPPFDHSKIMVVDGEWALIGSGNWDARSFRLNFEFNLECYHSGFANGLLRIVKGKIENARKITVDELKGRSILTKLRDGASFMLSPYL